MVLPATDSFTNTNGTAIGTHNSSWSETASGFVIQNNRIASDDTDTPHLARWNADTFDDDQYSQAVAFTTAGGSGAIGVAARVDTGGGMNAYHFAWRNFGSAKRTLGKTVADVFTALDSDGAVPSGGELIRVECEGTTIRGLVDTVEIFSVTDASISSGAAGLYSANNADSTKQLDDWEGGNLSGGLSTVTSDSVILWNILNSVNSDLSARWNILNTVNGDLQLQWNILNGVNSDVHLLWNIKNLISSDLQLLWNILNSGQSDLTALWNILNSANTDVVLRWNILNSVNSDLQIVWNIEGGLFTDLQLLWNIQNRVTSDLSILWNVLNQQTSDLNALWNILNSVDSDLSLRWTILERINSNLVLRWNINSDLTFPDIEGVVTMDTATGKITILSGTDSFSYL